MRRLINTELKRRYLSLACLIKRKKQKSEKNLTETDRANRSHKLHEKENYPFVQIFNPNLDSTEFWTNNIADNVPSGIFKKVGSFPVIIHSDPHKLISPSWRNILEQCPAEYAKEGFGLCLLRTTKKTDEKTKTWVVNVMRVDHSLSYLSDEELENEIDESKNFIGCYASKENLIHSLVNHEIDDNIISFHIESIVSKLNILRLMKESFRRQDIFSFEYCAFLYRSTVLKKIRQLKKEGKDTKRLIELSDIMKWYPERFLLLKDIG
jgi:hypothetical protein